MAGTPTGKEKKSRQQCLGCPATFEVIDGFGPVLDLCLDCHRERLTEFWKVYNEEEKKKQGGKK